MSITANQIMTLDGQILPFARDLREALAVYARRQWPTNTSGHAAKAWGLPKTTMTNLLKGHASDATVTAVIRAGGWPLALAVVGATIGESLDEFINKEQERLRHERRAYEEREARLGEMARHMRARAGLGGGGSPELEPRRPREGRSFSRRVGDQLD